MYFLALDCNKEDPDNGYSAYEYTSHVTSIIYREEQAGFLAGYGAVKDGYRKLGFCGGMAVPAVVRYGSGYCQGADLAAQELSLAAGSIGVQYYYAGKFAATDQATQYCTSWYKNGTADIIFGCGGAVYNSVTAASQANSNKPWIGVDVNQHADTSLGASQASCITSAMKNLQNTTQIMLASFVNTDERWACTYAGKVITVGAKSDNCVLPTPATTGDNGCWGFKTFTQVDYATILGKLKAGTVAVNSCYDDASLKAHNFGCSDKVVVNYIA
jgi:basic membrane protein A